LWFNKEKATVNRFKVQGLEIVGVYQSFNPVKFSASKPETCKPTTSEPGTLERLLIFFEKE